MRKAPSKTRRSGRAILASAVGCAILAAAAATSARAGDDDGDVPFDTKIFRSFMESMGLQGNDRVIDYRERSPLVVPQSTTSLPPPESNSVVDNNPAWPVDQDVKRERERKVATKRERVIGDSVRDQERVLRPDELAGGTIPRSRTKNVQTDEFGKPLPPSKLGYKGGLFSSMFSKSDESAKFTGEPERASLTDPPPGYQTPSPTQPYGVSKDKSYGKAEDYATTHVEPTR